MKRREWDKCESIGEMLKAYPLARKIEVLFCCNVLKEVGGYEELVSVREKYEDGLASHYKLRESFFNSHNQTLLVILHPSEDYVKRYKDLDQFIVHFGLFRINLPNILREIKNPFHTPKLYSKKIRTFAELIYKTQDYTAYPVLHDMLLDEDCEDNELLNHLKEDKHLRGCWALRSLL